MTREPTLYDVPRILFRAALRLVARVVFVLAGATFFATVVLLWCSFTLATWRITPGRKSQAFVDFFAAGLTLVKEIKPLGKTPKS